MSNNSPKSPNLAVYMLRALYSWIVDSGMTPMVRANAGVEGVVVPKSAVVDGFVTLNIGPRATGDLQITDEFVFFKTRFNTISHEIVLPIESVLFAFARETGHGMQFADASKFEQKSEAAIEDKSTMEQGPAVPAPSVPVEGRKVAHLTVVK